jgi:hypothetical protein
MEFGGREREMVLHTEATIALNPNDFWCSSRKGHTVPVLMAELNLICITQDAQKSRDGF